MSGSGSTPTKPVPAPRRGSKLKEPNASDSWVARDVTKNQTKKLSILLSFYSHEVLQYLNIFT